jgi:hypothetical protein
MFSLFTHIILLHLGSILYCGPSSSCLSYFTSLGHPCPPLENPPEFYLDVIQAAAEKERREMERKEREKWEREGRRLHEGKWKRLEDRIVKEEPHLNPLNIAAISSPAVLRVDQRISTPHPRSSSRSPHHLPSSHPVQLRSKGFSKLDLPAEDVEDLARKMGRGKEEREEKGEERDQKKPKEPASSTTASSASSASSFLPPIASLFVQAHATWVSLYYLTHRAYLNSSRLPLLKGAQVLQTLVLGLLVGGAFFNLGTDQLAVQNRLGAVYFILICVIFANTLAVVLTCE